VWMKKLLFKNARVVSSQGIERKDVVVSGGEILKVCEVGEGEDLLANIVDEKKEMTFASGEQDLPDGNGGFVGEECEIIDCSGEGKYLIPGVIDAHVHFREPGMIAKEDFATGSRAALAGGVTTIFDMPNTKPATITFEVFAEKVELGKRNCKCHFKLFFGAVSEESLVELKKVLADEELVRFLAGVKVYMGHSTGGLGATDILEKLIGDVELARGLEVFDGRVLPIVVHAEDQECLDENESKYNPAKPETHGDARPVECGVIAVKEVCHLARKYDRPVHIAHVSSREELDVIGECRDDLVDVGEKGENGLRGALIKKVPLVTCEVSPRHLFLNDGMYEKLGAKLKVNPPVRSKEEAEELLKGLVSGEVDMIATDHSPHTLEEKGFGKNPGNSSDEIPSGMPDVQTLLPLMLNAVVKEDLDLQRVVELCCEKPAEIFGLENVGRIEEGARADLVLVDLGEKRKVGEKGAELKYKCGWSCYEGWELSGWPEVVVLAGEIVSV